MLKIAAVLFALAAVGGIVLAALHFKKKNAPTGLALLHGLLAAAGLVLFIIAALSVPLAESGKISLVLFIVAALGGFVLFAMHLKKRTLPSGVIVIHGLVAVVAFLLLLSLIAGR